MGPLSYVACLDYVRVRGLLLAQRSLLQGVDPHVQLAHLLVPRPEVTDFCYFHASPARSHLHLVRVPVLVHLAPDRIRTSGGFRSCQSCGRPGLTFRVASQCLAHTNGFAAQDYLGWSFPSCGFVSYLLDGALAMSSRVGSLTQSCLIELPSLASSECTISRGTCSREAWTRLVCIMISHYHCLISLPAVWRSMRVLISSSLILEAPVWLWGSLEYHLYIICASLPGVNSFFMDLRAKRRDRGAKERIGKQKFSLRPKPYSTRPRQGLLGFPHRWETILYKI